MSRMSKQANILDPVKSELDPRVFDLPADPRPRLKPQHRGWIIRAIHKTLEDGGYEGMDKWLSLVFTGSLTTYQYSDESDVDISLFVDVKNFPDWSRAEMIALMIDKMDGTLLPGTPYPLQCFVVSSKLSKDDLYQPGMRSGYDLDNDDWIVPPERERVHDIEAEMNGDYVYALQCADKMAMLLKHEPDKAVTYWHQIHRRRRRDMLRGRGDYCLAPNVKVLTDRYEWKPIGEVVLGEVLIGFDEHIQGRSSDGTTRGLQRTFQPSIVQSVESKILPSYQIVTDKNAPIVASANHLWLVRGRKRTVVWKATNELVVGDQIIRFGETWKEPCDPVEAAYLAGLMDGEGHITKLGKLSFAQKGGLVLERGKSALTALGYGHLASRTPDPTGKYDTAFHVQIYGGVAETMKFLYQIPTVRLRTQNARFWVGRQISPKGRYLDEGKCLATVQQIQFVGEREVVALSTSTRTLIAEGLYSHNSQSNIVYKMLFRRGLIPDIANLSGEHIAKTAMDWQKYYDMVEQESEDAPMGEQPWRHGVCGKCFMDEAGRVHSWTTDAPDDNPSVGVPHHSWMAHNVFNMGSMKGSGWIYPDGRIHFPYLDTEPTDEYDLEDIVASIPGTRRWEPEGWEAQPDNDEDWDWLHGSSSKIAVNFKQPTVCKFVYNVPANHLIVGSMAREEGEVESHFDLLRKAGLDPKNNVYGQFDPSGRVVTFGRPMIEGFGKPAMNPKEADYRAKQALEMTVPGTRFDTLEPSHDKWTLTEPPKVTYMREPPVIGSEPAQPDEWTFSKIAADWQPNPERVEQARKMIGLERPVRFLPRAGVRGGYAGISRDPMTGRDSHLVYIGTGQHSGARNWAAWHELGHAVQHERGDEFEPTTDMSDEDYKASPKEREAERIADLHADFDLFGL